MVSVASRAAVMAISCAMLPYWASAAHADCSRLLPQAETAEPHIVTARDLARLRDIGTPEPLSSDPSPLALSPDGHAIAFVLSQPDPETNHYCRALVVVDYDRAATPRIIDSGGDLITGLDPAAGIMVHDGAPRMIVPAWSPDGKWVAYLRRDAGETQIWLAAADGSGAHQLTHATFDVDRFVWSDDGAAISYASRLGLATARQSIDAARRTGWRYDATFTPTYGTHPQLPGDIPFSYRTIVLETAVERPATPLESQKLIDSGQIAVTAKGWTAAVSPVNDKPFAPTRILIAHDGEHERVCAAAPCRSGIIGLWWDRDAKRLFWLRHEGWKNEATALYVWAPQGSAPPHRNFTTTDALIGCQMAHGALLCLRENATTARRVVAVVLATGHSDVIYDPNPETAAWRTGRVRRLHWINDLGLPAWGDLVLPPDYHSGDKVPLVIVQYHSDGFLRGGTGDEYPIFALAGQGMAVLSVERPPFFAQGKPLKNWDEFNLLNQKDWAERRSVFSSLMAGVKAALDTGAIDPARIGITGLSDGATSARFALINAPGTFRAAAFSTCCTDTRTAMTYTGFGFADGMHDMGMPYASVGPIDDWRPVSIPLNAAAMTTPLLLQLADDEMILAMETVTALREHHQPFEMYVYPREFHVKWQPAHRLAIYQRNIDWFAYWLEGHKDPDPAKRAQYVRWDAMPRPPVTRHARSAP